jgi:hypothetical protein
MMFLRQRPRWQASPAVFSTPGSREIVLGGHTVGYALKRVRRRSIGFIVGTDGLSVNAPNWVGVRDIESALREKASWILGKLHEQQQRGRRLQSARVDWRDGATIPFLGQTVVVVLDQRAGIYASGMCSTLRSGDALMQGCASSRRLHIGLPPGALPEQIRDAVQSWLQRQAKRVFAERCDAMRPGWWSTAVSACRLRRPAGAAPVPTARSA